MTIETSACPPVGLFVRLTLGRPELFNIKKIYFLKFQSLKLKILITKSHRTTFRRPKEWPFWEAAKRRPYFQRKTQGTYGWGAGRIGASGFGPSRGRWKNTTCYHFDNSIKHGKMVITGTCWNCWLFPSCRGSQRPRPLAVGRLTSFAASAVSAQPRPVSVPLSSLNVVRASEFGHDDQRERFHVFRILQRLKNIKIRNLI